MDLTTAIKELGLDFDGLMKPAPTAPKLSAEEKRARIVLLERVGRLDFAPVLEYLDGMLDMYRAELETPMSDARTNYVRGAIATIRFFLSLPASVQNELEALQAPDEGETDTPNGEGS